MLPGVLRWLLVVAAVGAVLVPSPRTGAAPPAEPFAAWLGLTLDEIAAHRLDPPHASRLLATVSVADERAVARVEGRSAEIAAVNGAAATVVPYFFPDRAAAFAEMAAPFEHERGFAAGVDAGRELLARAAADGADTPWTGVIPVGPEFWVPTPPAFLPPLLPGWGAVRPWNVRDPAALVPGPPPRPGSPQFAAELREVFDVSQTLTPEQREIALFWADGAGTFTPPGHWDAVALQVLDRHPLPLGREAVLFAALNTAQADAFICAWLTKYRYWSIRPVTAIRRELDPTWTPLIVTPPFPSYISGHSTTSAAAATVLSSFFPADAAQLRAWAEQAAMSRLYGGIHFRSDNEVGLRVGAEVGRVALASWLDRAG